MFLLDVLSILLAGTTPLLFSFVPLIAFFNVVLALSSRPWCLQITTDIHSEAESHHSLLDQMVSVSDRLG